MHVMLVNTLSFFKICAHSGLEVLNLQYSLQGSVARGDSLASRGGEGNTDIVAGAVDEIHVSAIFKLPTPSGPDISSAVVNATSTIAASATLKRKGSWKCVCNTSRCNLENHDEALTHFQRVASLLLVNIQAEGSSP